MHKMKKLIKVCSLLFLTAMSFPAVAQAQLKSADELIAADSAWPLVQEWLSTAKNKVEILDATPGLAKSSLFNAQVSTYSTLGAVIYNTGGILIDQGWLRILGSGSIKLNRSVAEWNKGKSIKNYGDQPAYLLVADDAAGGFFAINYGAFGEDLKNIYYLAPNSLKWEPLNLGYSEFILFCFEGDLTDFYKGLRWSSWDQFIANLDGSKSYSFRPYLWSEEAKDINESTRKLVSTEELFQFNLLKQKELLKAKASPKPEG